ncbi:NlpC/P60 family protein [Actinomadura adrarensis]|uniref:NlpC/P60 family protein n=1 Tax=Actinomadura adrarensis TaxID=1819600 RepID=A0ABW3CR64_9ACTN
MTSSNDTGTVHLAVTAGIGALLVLIAVFLGAGATITDTLASCHPAPGTSREAEGGIPSDYLTLYRNSGKQTGIPWNILAAIGKVESDHGRNNPSSSGVRSGSNWAGAAGPMQIGIGGKATNNWGGPPRHRADHSSSGYATDGNHDGWANVYDPADAIPAAASMLKDHGAPGDIRRALYAYNPSSDYVELVLNWAGRYADSPALQTASNSSACQPELAAAPASGTATAKVIAYAQAQLGKPYIWGAEGPDAYDCSGLTMMAYRAADIPIPRTTFAQWRHGTHIPKGQQQPGDLVFFNSGPGSSTDNPGHVGVVLDDQKMINARCTTCRPGIAVQNYAQRDDLAGFVRPTTER